MFCPKCGKENEDQARFCKECGANLQNIAMGSNDQQTIVSNAVEYAGFWRRFAAALIDGIVVNICIAVIAFIFVFMYGLSTRTTEGAEVLGFIIGIAVNWIYFAGLESSDRQATVGKMAIGIIVSDLSGNRISFGKATVRHFAKLISALILLIGFLMVGFTEKKQGLHDMLAECMVVVKK